MDQNTSLLWHISQPHVTAHFCFVTIAKYRLLAFIRVVDGCATTIGSEMPVQFLPSAIVYNSKASITLKQVTTALAEHNDLPCKSKLKASILRWWKQKWAVTCGRDVMCQSMGPCNLDAKQIQVGLDLTIAKSDFLPKHFQNPKFLINFKK